MMGTTYKNRGGKSGVAEYEIGANFIKVRFKTGRDVYVYDYISPGQTHVEELKLLAVDGLGLSTYISQNVRNGYSRIE